MDRSTVPCPHCGGEIRSDAAFCRHCGSSDSDGWREPEEFDGPLDDFDYDEFVSRELADSATRTEIRPIWRWVAVVLLMVLIASFLVSIL